MNSTITDSLLAVKKETLLTPYWAEVVEIKQESGGIWTIWLRFLDQALQDRFSFAAGQFNMLYLPGYGEAAISISSDPQMPELIGHTIRFVGNVTHAVSRLHTGDTIGLRGPFGTAWPLETCQGGDIVIAAGGIGMAPLRPVIYQIINRREQFGRVVLLHGARTPADLLYSSEYSHWGENQIEVMTTVDRADESWLGQVGVVPMLFYRLNLDTNNTVVFTCGPEIMMRFVVFEALARRIAPQHIHLSLERNMKCGQGFCGHCQYGPFFICKDGPVYSFDRLAPFFNLEDF